MTWLLVARWMAADARRSRGLWAVVVLFAVVGVAAAVLPAAVVGGSLSAGQAVAYLVAPLEVVVALTALLGGYGAIAGPRAGGQLALLLGLPVDRTALVAGAFVGRTAVVLGGVTAGLAVVAGALSVVYGGLPLVRLAGFGALLALLAVTMTALAVGISSAVSTPGRAAVAAVAAFVLFQFFWEVVPAGAHYLVEGSFPGQTVPAWVVLLERLQPLAAFEAATDLVLPRAETGVRLSAGGAEAAQTVRPTALRDRLEGPPPSYLDPWAGVVTLAGWAVATLVAGWFRFRQADLR